MWMSRLILDHITECIHGTTWTLHTWYTTPSILDQACWSPQSPAFSRSRAPLELEVFGGLARAEVVFELLEQRLDARPRELGVDAQLRIALLERVLPGLGQGLDALLQLATRLPGMPRYAVRRRLVRVPRTYCTEEALGRPCQHSVAASTRC